MTLVPFTDEVIVTTNGPTTIDDNGDPTPADPTRVTVMGLFAPAVGTETLDNQDQVISQPQAFLPAGTVVTSTSTLTINGHDYEVTGEPEDWSGSFSSWAPGIAVTLRRITG